ncbi:Uncharacterised protein [Streptococcus pneumoniae]|nr:Uncharacterised protein [Streptococcus pneumoniae]
MGRKPKTRSEERTELERLRERRKTEIVQE